ncbi:MAG TPA: hypothetical protein ENH82_20085 [bacterium]|nr:hypothetical protein [bacterium]
MPGPKVTVKFDNKIFKKYIKEVAQRTKRGSDILKAAAATFGFKDIIDHFKKESGPEGKWKERSTFTQEFYLAIQKGATDPPEGTARGAYRTTNKILQLTGNLRKSFLPTNIKKVNNQSVLMFTKVPYAGGHEFGNKKTNLPERSFMWLSASAMEKMNRMILRLIAGN